MSCVKLLVSCTWRLGHSLVEGPLHQRHFSATHKPHAQVKCSALTRNQRRYPQKTWALAIRFPLAQSSLGLNRQFGSLAEVTVRRISKDPQRDKEAKLS